MPVNKKFIEQKKAKGLKIDGKFLTSDVLVTVNTSRKEAPLFEMYVSKKSSSPKKFNFIIDDVSEEKVW